MILSKLPLFELDSEAALARLLLSDMYISKSVLSSFTSSIKLIIAIVAC